MRKLISNSKIMCGIFRAIVLEAWNTEASLYIPALHRTQMPFAIDESGTITGLANGESLDVLDHTNSVSTPISTDNSSLPDSSEEDEENSDDNDQEGEETENPDEDEEDDETNSETQDTEPEETDEEESNEEGSNTSATVTPSEPMILTDNAGNKLAMQLKDFPKAQLSCWIGRSTVKPGMPLWIAFENEDSEFPIILGTLGSTLEYGELGSLLGGGGSASSGTLSTVGFNGEYYEGLPTYSLSEDQITHVATWVTGECGGEDIIACKRIASQMANLSEFQNNDRADYDTLHATLNSGWYDPKAFTLGCTETAKSAVKECLVDGKRVLPRYVVEFCTFASQYISTYKEAESWNRGDPVVQTFGGGGTFYFVCFDKTDLSNYDLNIMGYTEASYERYKDDDTKKVSSSISSDVVNAMFTEGLRIINKGVPYAYGGNSDSGYDCSGFVSKCLNAAGFNVGRLTTNSLITTLPQIGWQEITSSVNRFTGEGLLPGDIGVSSSHTEIFYSNNPLQELGAHNSTAGITIRGYSTWFWPKARVYRHNGS